MERAQVDLGDVSPLMRGLRMGPFGRPVPALTRDAVRLSAELCGDAYALDTGRWEKAGWQDVALQVNDETVSAVSQQAGGLAVFRQVAARVNDLRLRRMKSVMGGGGLSPLVSGAASLYDDERVVVKAVAMLHPAPGGRWVAAVQFIGTVPRLDDWLANFRMAPEDGIHRGFAQMARRFEALEKDLQFPAAAAALGLPRLTLKDIAAECARPDSRFFLWLTGHSQGGAVMQLYARDKLRADGVLPENMLGVGFASPRVAAEGAVDDPSGYPLYHVVNSDDLTPRLGSVVRLGTDLVFRADEELRRACYRWPRGRDAVEARLAARPVMWRMGDIEGCMVTGAAICRAIMEAPAGDVVPALGALQSSAPLQRRILEFSDHSLNGVLGRILRRAEENHQAILGRPMAPEAVADAREAVDRAVRKVGIRRMMAALGQMASAPHGITARGEGEGTAPYLRIARECWDRLRPQAWTDGGQLHPSDAGTLEDYEGGGT